MQAQFTENQIIGVNVTMEEASVKSEIWKENISHLYSVSSHSICCREPSTAIAISQSPHENFFQESAISVKFSSHGSNIEIIGK